MKCCPFPGGIIFLKYCEFGVEFLYTICYNDSDYKMRGNSLLSPQRVSLI